jgi:hypothetical protein
MIDIRKKLIEFALLVSFALFASVASADTAEELKDLKSRLSELEQKLKDEQEKTDVIAGEVSNNKVSSLIPAKKELKSIFGFGPSASSVYQVDQGLSLAGYGEAYYQNFTSDAGENRDLSDMLRAVTYLGYRFNDWIVMNTEIEFEHGSTNTSASEENGSVSVEFSYLDFFLNEAANVRAGLLLVPMGFINEIHEPAYFHGVQRPEVERRLIPTTWREMGAGLFGKLGDSVEYRSYVVGGLRANSFTSAGIRDGRQSGVEAITEDFGWVSRVDYTPPSVDGLLVGSSFYLGNAGQKDTFVDQEPSVRTTMLEGHAQYKASGLELRALGVWTFLDDTELLSQALDQPIGERQYGWYGEAAYDVLPLFGDTKGHYLAPFFRYERFDTQASVPSGFTPNPEFNKTLYSFGLTYKPISQIAIKAEYRDFKSRADKDPADSFLLGLGFAL